jgi:hypothetical protein
MLKNLFQFFSDFKNRLKSDAKSYLKKRNRGDYIDWVSHQAHTLDGLDESKNKFLRKLRKEAFPIKLFLEKNPDLNIKAIQLSYHNESWDAKCYIQNHLVSSKMFYLEVTGTRGYNGNAIEPRIFRDKDQSQSIRHLSEKISIAEQIRIIKERIDKKAHNLHYDSDYILLIYSEDNQSNEQTFDALIENLAQDKDFFAKMQTNIFHAIYIIQWNGQDAFSRKIK